MMTMSQGQIMKIAKLMCFTLLPYSLVNHSIAKSENSANQDCFNISSANWLLGEWESRSPQNLISESWKKSGESLIGKGVTKKRQTDSSEFVEHLYIQTVGNDIFYSAKPPQNEFPTSFKLTDCSKKHLKFENSTHDFPQVISYNKVDKNRIRADVSSKDNKGFSIDFNRRVAELEDRTNIVMSYVEAYNKKDLAGMMKFITTDIHWMSINGKTITTETNSREELAETLKQHFKGSIKYHSSLSNISVSGAFVSATEKSVSLLPNKKSTTCSLSVYEFSQEKGQSNLIKNVWYHTAEKCE
jgi:ketosteroid isomerase-like protein